MSDILSPALGNKAKSIFPKDIQHLQRDTLSHWERWGLARDLRYCPGKIQWCSTQVQHRPDITQAAPGGVDVQRRLFEDGRVTVAPQGLITCNRHACPLCRARWVWRGAENIIPIMKGWGDVEGRCLHVTLTIRHDVNLGLETLTDLIAKAWTRWRLITVNGASKNRPPEIPELIGVPEVRVMQITRGGEGSIRGDNGWHPHYHVVFFVRGNVDVADLEKRLGDAWIEAVEFVTRDTPGLQRRVTPAWPSACKATLHGPGMQSENTKLSWYVLGALEMLRDDLKSGGRDPLELLDDPDTAHLWVEYARAFEGKKLISWGGRRSPKRWLEEEIERHTTLESPSGETPTETETVRVSLGGWDFLLGVGKYPANRQSPLICCFLAALQIGVSEAHQWWTENAPDSEPLLTVDGSMTDEARAGPGSRVCHIEKGDPTNKRAEILSSLPSAGARLEILRGDWMGGSQAKKTYTIRK